MNELEEKLGLKDPSILDKVYKEPTACNLQEIPKIKQTYDLLKYVCEKDGLALKYAAKKLITPELCEIAVSQNGMALEFIPSRITKEKGIGWCRILYKKAVKSNGSALQFIPDDEKNQNIVETALLIGDYPIGKELRYMNYPVAYAPNTSLTNELLEKVVDRIPLCIRDIPKRRISKKLSYIAAKGNGLALRYIPNRFINKEIVDMAISENVVAVRYVPVIYLTQEICDKCVEQNPGVLSCIPIKFITKEMCIKIINTGGLSVEGDTLSLRLYGVFGRVDKWLASFEDIPEELRNDKAILKEFIYADNHNAIALLKWNEYILGAQSSFLGPRKDMRGYEIKPLHKKTVEYLKAEYSKIMDEQNKWANNMLCVMENNLLSNDQLKMPSDKDIPKSYSIIPKGKNEIITHDFLASENVYLRFYYISDIHIEHQISGLLNKIKNKSIDVRLQAVTEFINDKIRDMVSEIDNKRDILLIGGDVADSPILSLMFYKELRRQWRGGYIISVLGNHELWDGTNPENWNSSDYQARPIKDIVSDYMNRIQEYWSDPLDGEPYIISGIKTEEDAYYKVSGSVLLENELYVRFKNSKSRKISEYDILNSSDNDLAELLSKCSIIILGGIGYSGLNPVYNSNAGLYRKAINTQDEDVRRSEAFRKVYDKVKKCAEDRRVIVLTHNPVYDWTNEECNANWIYVNGHTHRNTLKISENGAIILSDNQIGYKPSIWKLKSFVVDMQWYDPFEKRDDGIYEITSEEYREFNRGRGIACNGCSYAGKLYMLKRNEMYMFLLKSERSLCLMVGGQRKRLDHYDVDYYYNNMDRYSDNIKKMISPYQKVMKQLSEEIKRFGGSGYIHGCIVDISFFSHIYVNPLDGKITPYWALDILSRKPYINVQNLLESEEPQLLKRFLIESKRNTIPLIGKNLKEDRENTELVTIPEWVLGTDIYKPSRIMRSIQYIWEQNVIRIWNDDVLREDIKNKPLMIE